jgi:PD-(D/E)XK nuclease superfamily protein
MSARRNTGTGGVLERMVLPALDQGGYSHRVQVNIGQRLGCGQHNVDVIAQKNGEQFLVSMKWQQVSGTAEQKVPFEVICLLEALQSGSFTKAFLVLGGEGWTLRDFYTSGGLNRYISGADRVEVLTLESFVGRANAGRL